MKNIYTEKSWWPSCHYDGRRKKYFLNKSMEEFESDKQKHFQRQQIRWITDNLEKSRFRMVSISSSTKKIPSSIKKQQIKPSGVIKIPEQFLYILTKY